MKYDRELLEKAEGAVGKGRKLSLADAADLWEDAGNGAWAPGFGALVCRGRRD